MSKENNAYSGFTSVLQSFNAIKIYLASPEQIRGWSHGEVKKPETINYRTLKAERDGLFCQKIFGPTRDYECACGKYKRMRYKGQICDKCQVEVTSSSVRRDRMGHIELAHPVAHVWYFKSFGSKLSYVLDINAVTLESIINFEKYIVIDPGESELELRQILSIEEAQLYLGNPDVLVQTGAQAVKDILKDLNLELEYNLLKKQYSSTKAVSKRARIIKRMQVLDMFIKSGTKPEYMILDVLPVLPPELRPLVSLDGGRFAVSDLNDLYRRIINRNNRLKKLQSLNAPELIILNEKRMIQEAVNSLLDNSKASKPVMNNTGKRLCKSLSDLLKGKQGRFRQNLLGKRVDYSGRSVIVVGPELKLHQCGIPKNMALELFKPHVYGLLERKGLATNIRIAKFMLENEKPEVWDTLEEVIQDYLVILNRAPTLHRLGVQAFEPKLIEGKAIKLHPLTCAAFNADFDGDQMAVHLPLSPQAQAEARNLMLASKNILTPASGEPTIVPTKDIVVGIYYLTMKQGEAGSKTPTFSDIYSIQKAVYFERIKIHDTIYFYHNNTKYETSAGRVILFNIMPEGIDFSIVNKLLGKSEQRDLVNYVYSHYDADATVKLADDLMQIGFEYATLSGLSIAKDDLLQPTTKAAIIEKSEADANNIEAQYEEGIITPYERYNKIVDLWSEATETVIDSLMDEISRDNNGHNSIFIMSDSGARGSREQIRQLCGMRGLMTKPSGEIILNPIKTNFKEGLSVHNYFNSTHGARKGMADTALKTADSGYLTRRLVDVAQDVIISHDDCKTSNFIEVTNLDTPDGLQVMEVYESLLGRVIAQDVIDSDGNIIVNQGDLITDKLIERIREGSNEVKFKVRSPVTCEAKKGICAKCYGVDLSTRNELICEGSAVGVIAAQSIGEPGTQLTMRTFHMGGAASKAAERSSVISDISGKLFLTDAQLLKTDTHSIVISRDVGIYIEAQDGTRTLLGSAPNAARVYFQEGEMVNEGDMIAQWDPHAVQIISEVAGIVNYVHLTEGISMVEENDQVTGAETRSVIDWRKCGNSDFNPRIEIVDTQGNALRTYYLAIGTSILVSDGERVKSGDVIAKLSKLESKTRDITGGLPRVVELFEARRLKNAAIMSTMDGYITFGNSYRSNRKVIIKSEDSEISDEILVPKGRHLLVQDGARVTKGQPLIDAAPDPHDILAILGFDALVAHLTKEVQLIYRAQGVKIHSKHIETIIRQMTKKVVIIDSGDSDYVKGNIRPAAEVAELNIALAKAGKSVVAYQQLLQGITKASLQTESWLSAASFQDTTRILIDSAIMKKVDKLEGLKENVAVGRLITAGTGFVVHNHVKKVFSEAEQQDLELAKV